MIEIRRCDKCHYRREMFGFPEHPACHYAVDEGQLRGCDPEECSRFKPRRRWRAISTAARAAERILEE